MALGVKSKLTVLIRHHFHFSEGLKCGQHYRDFSHFCHFSFLTHNPQRCLCYTGKYWIYVCKTIKLTDCIIYAWNFVHIAKNTLCQRFIKILWKNFWNPSQGCMVLGTVCAYWEGRVGSPTWQVKGHTETSTAYGVLF